MPVFHSFERLLVALSLPESPSRHACWLTTTPLRRFCRIYFHSIFYYIAAVHDATWNLKFWEAHAIPTKLKGLFSGTTWWKTRATVKYKKMVSYNHLSSVSDFVLSKFVIDLHTHFAELRKQKNKTLSGKSSKTTSTADMLRVKCF